MFFSAENFKLVALLLLFVGLTVIAEEKQAEDVDEGSCICGINNELIRKLELILQAASTNCAGSSSHSTSLSGTAQQSQESGDTNQHVAVAANARDPGGSDHLDNSMLSSQQNNEPGGHPIQSNDTSSVSEYGNVAESNMASSSQSGAVTQPAELSSTATISPQTSSSTLTLPGQTSSATLTPPEQTSSSTHTLPEQISSSTLTLPGQTSSVTVTASGWPYPSTQIASEHISSSSQTTPEQPSSSATLPSQVTSLPDLTHLVVLLSQQGYNSSVISHIINHLDLSQSSTIQGSSITPNTNQHVNPNPNTNSNAATSVQHATESSSSDKHELVGNQPVSASASNQQVSGGLDTAQMILQLTAELHKLQAQLSSQSTNSQDNTSSQSQNYQTLTSQPASAFVNNQLQGGSQASFQGSTQITPFTHISQSSHLTIAPVNVPTSGDSKLVSTAIQTLSSNDILGGLPSVETNDALNKLNQSKTVAPQEMASALQSTVPGVVSNIFSDIQNLTLHQNSHQLNDHNDPNMLTSIDGSSVSLEGDTSNQIKAEGEKMFSLWIEHQLEGLHLTASMANYIRKNAMNLFKRIASQYVERASQLGGSVERNVQEATQKALTTSQNLSSFLLKNYVNFAGGLMQIIGEQVSRVGKQLDSTGDTIAHINLNPFDIVSNVIDSLPNPSDYSQYFRAFGKQLMGEFLPSTQTPSESTSSSDQQLPSPSPQPQPNDQATPQPASSSPKPSQGLLSKTMKSLGKTMSSWIG